MFNTFPRGVQRCCPSSEPPPPRGPDKTVVGPLSPVASPLSVIPYHGKHQDTFENWGVKLVTDVVSQPDAETEAIDGAESTAALAAPGAEAPSDGQPPQTGEQAVAWAPIEPTPKKKRLWLWLWLGIGAGALVLGAGAASTILIAPGTTVVGVSVGWLTPGAAADAISTHLAETEVTLTGTGGDAVLTGADLGATTDASALADAAFAARPMWNLGTWMGAPITGEIAFDPAAADSALRAAVPSSYTEPVDAGVAFDAGANAYGVTPSENGTAVDVDGLTAAFAETVAGGGKSLEFSGAPAEALPAVSDADAGAMAEQLNGMLGTIGFYVGEERTVPVEPAVAATWLTVVDNDGTLAIQADPAAIQATVDGLAGAVDRAPVNATNIVDSAGTVLRAEVPGVTGRTLGDTGGIAQAFAEQLQNGQSAYPLTVEETAFSSTNLVRNIEVNLSTQTAILYENGNVVRSWAISSGRDVTPSHQGRFKVYAHVRMQDMISRNADGSLSRTPNVPWVTYYNGDEAFHGTYWHNNFGTQMSHGCINMPIDVARFVYEWAPVGLEVWVHS